MERPWDVVVVGAGVVGCAVAYFLARERLSVCLVDRGAVAGGTSSASAGHTSVQGRVPGPALELALGSVRLLEELRETLPGDIEYVQSGGIVVAENEVEYRLLREFARRQHAHVPVEFWEAGELRKAEPHLSPRFVGATYCALDGYANPIALAVALARGAQANGADVRTHTEVVGVVVRDGRAAGVRTRHETIPAGAVVVAAGVWSPDVARLAGLDVTVVPRKGQLLVTEPLPPLVNTMLSHAGHVPFREHGIATPPEFAGELQKKRYLKQTKSGPLRGRVYVGSTSEFVGFDRRTTWDGIAELAAYAVDTVPALARARLVRTWAGLRPRSGDGQFVIGAAPGLPGLYLATGHDSVGVLYSTMTGKLLGELIHRGARSALLAPFDPGRPSLATAER